MIDVLQICCLCRLRPVVYGCCPNFVFVPVALLPKLSYHPPPPSMAYRHTWPCSISIKIEPKIEQKIEAKLALCWFSDVCQKMWFFLGWIEHVFCDMCQIYLYTTQTWLLLNDALTALLVLAWTCIGHGGREENAHHSLVISLPLFTPRKRLAWKIVE